MVETVEKQRAADKPGVLLGLADCGVREGLNEAQQTELNRLRLDVMLAIEADSEPQLRAAKTAFLGFYQAMPEIKNGDNVMTATRALASDVTRLHEAVCAYDPKHQHPNYARGA